MSRNKVLMKINGLARRLVIKDIATVSFTSRLFFSPQTITTTKISLTPQK